jgi:outer membrane protein OmpA-like peptidoglycan-associated protein
MSYRICRKSLFAVLAASTVACGHRARPESPDPVAPESTPAVEVFGPASGGHIPADLLTADQRSSLDRRISFAFDRWDLSADAREILSEKAEILRQVPKLRLRIEGHADERGSDEYNLALSIRRAGAATRYLLSHGIDSGRLETMGYGEEQPLDPSENEAAWALNRRDEFRLSVGPLAQQ